MGASTVKGPANSSSSASISAAPTSCRNLENSPAELASTSSTESAGGRSTLSTEWTVAPQDSSSRRVSLAHWTVAN